MAPGAFTPAHHGGEGPPLVLLHGFTDTWRTWELVLPALERHHEVLAPTLTGHAGGPPLVGPVTSTTMVEGVERAMDAAGWGTAHVVGNSLGGFTALQLAARGRAESVVALAPAGGWADGDQAKRRTLRSFTMMLGYLRPIVASADAIAATPEGRRRATASTSVAYEHIPADLIAHMMVGAAGCVGAEDWIAFALRERWQLDAAAIDCPVRIVWGTQDALLPWPSTAVRYRQEWLPHADWVELEGVGHCPQLDVPLETAQLILGVTRG